MGAPPRYRFDNQLSPLVNVPPLTEEVLRGLLFPLLTEEQIERLTASPPSDVDAAFDWAEQSLSFRINAFHDRDGLACAIRAIPRSIPPLEGIGFPSDRTWKEIVELRQGLVIVTGITGSGKSTTLASLVQYINETRKARILTLEDPIEYVIPSGKALVSQREVGRHVPSFQDGLRSALREDPDVVLVGEMRDPETTSLALSAAETGHLVLSTLHTKDSRGAITRILDMFPGDRGKELATQLSFSLTYVLAQKLVPKARGGGRRLVMEVLKNVPGVSHQIRAGNLHQLYSALQTHKNQGLNTLEDHLLDLVRAGEIDRQVAPRHANDPTALGEL